MTREALIIFGLIAITLAAFHGAGTCEFVKFDDTVYIVDNAHVTSGLSEANFAWAWQSFEQGNYLPLTWISFQLDATLFGTHPRGFHWVNVGLHAINAVLLYVFFRRSTGDVWRSALVAAIFAVHPLRVESVVWVVERKDVLTGFFGLLTMLAYLRFARRLNWTWYAIALLLFAMTLLAKQTLATLPCVLLLLDYWPLGRWDKGPAAVSSDVGVRRNWVQLAVEKLPFLAMSAAILIATFHAQSQHAMASVTKLPISWRLGNALVSYARYLGKMFWFGGLAIFYDRHYWEPWKIGGACLLLVAITSICLWKSRTQPWLMIGWFWFVGVLFPMIGVVQFGPQAMADRFTYFSGIGLPLMVAWSIPRQASAKPRRVAAGAAIVLGVLIYFAMLQTSYWHNTISLFDHAVKVADSPMAELNLGSELVAQGRNRAGIAHLERAVNMDHEYGRNRWALALALSNNNQNALALPHAQAAVHLEPQNIEFRTTLAHIYRQLADYHKCVGECRIALEQDQNSAEALDELGMGLYKLGQRDDAMARINRALQIKPDLRSARVHLGQIFNPPAQQ